MKKFIKNEIGDFDQLAIVALIAVVAILIIVLYAIFKYLAPATCRNMPLTSQWIPWC